MSLVLDHLVVVAPTLEEGKIWVESLLGSEMRPGGRHNELGTHNALLRIGEDVFLEVIAIDPAAEHQGPRVFGIGDPEAARKDWEAGRRLQTWVARADALDEVLAEHAALLGVPKRVTRGERAWTMSIPPDGSLPLAGLLPTAVQYEPGMVPARHMPDAGCQLLGLALVHPEPERIRARLARLDVQGPVTVEQGQAPLLSARIATPQGEVELR
jgi:Glyoxalase-like domain